MEKESKYTIIKYEETDSDLISKLCSYIDLKAQKVIDFFDSKFELPKIEINIISTKEKYDKIIGNQKFDGHTPDWVVGNYDRKNNKINYVSYHDYQNASHKKDDFESYLQVLMHEYIHYVTAMYSNSIDSNYPIKYISEGIAYYLSGQGKNIYYDKNIDYNSIIYGTKSYSMWYLFVKYIIDQKGKDYFF